MTSVAATASLRGVTPADEPFLRQLYASTRAGEFEAVAWTPEEKTAFLNMQFDAQSRQYSGAYTDADTSFDIIEIDGAAAGRLYLAAWPAEIRIIDIALAPEYRGRGVGSALMQQILGTARTGGRCVTIHVEIDNPALHWYQRLGFVALEQRGLYTFMQWKG
jgi:ribosomal protein S18 acetylase RimI-like enzyme